MPVIYSDEKHKWIIVCYCGAKEPARWVSSSTKDEQGKNLEWCEVCSTSSASGIPDVYWDGKPETNLVDDKGRPMEFVSKGHKARWLKEKGLKEAGDRVRGGTAFDGVFEKRTPDRKAIREEVRQSLQEVRGMGRDRRRSEIQKFLKQRYG